LCLVDGCTINQAQKEPKTQNQRTKQHTIVSTHTTRTQNNQPMVRLPVWAAAGGPFPPPPLCIVVCCVVFMLLRTTTTRKDAERCAHCIAKRENASVRAERGGRIPFSDPSQYLTVCGMVQNNEE
jgi:hypothetical protein